MSSVSRLPSHSQTRFWITTLAGVALGVLIGTLSEWEFGFMGGWVIACILYLAMVWFRVRRMTGSETRDHATREDPGRAGAEALTTVALIVGMALVIVILAFAHGSNGIAKVGVPILGLLAIAATWFLVQTVFMLRYARLYYSDTPGGIDFNEQEHPNYSDFAYVAFTLGMTYQVSDTNLSTRAIRHEALRQSLISYFFGAFILAATVNIVAGLAG
jgi:uncharacterized membrane protein